MDEMSLAQDRALLSAFLAGAQERGASGEASRVLDPEEDVEVARALDEVLARAQAAWPRLALSPEVFARALGQRIPDQVRATEWLRGVHAGDVYLAVGCVAGDPTALQLLEQHYLRRLGSELRGSGGLARFSEEAQQMLRVRLLVGRDGQAPRLQGYRGTGPLQAWLRLTLTRLALDLAGGDKHNLDLDQVSASAPMPGEDPELAFLRRQYGEALHAAMTESFERVSEEQRTILRLHFLEGLSADQIGGLYRCSGRTVQRRIAEARRDILDRARALIGQRTGAAPSEVESIMRLAGSQMAISLQRVLKPQP